MTNEELIAVIQAEIDGKEIEMQLWNVREPWSTKPADCPWDFMSYRYRVKPGLKVMYINIYPGNYNRDRKSADQMAGDSRTACIRVEYNEGQFDA